MHRKSENLWCEISYSIVAPSGGAGKNVNMSAQLQIISYIKPQKPFQKVHRLIAYWLSQLVAMVIDRGHLQTILRR